MQGSRKGEYWGLKLAHYNKKQFCTQNPERYRSLLSYVVLL